MASRDVGCHIDHDRQAHAIAPACTLPELSAQPCASGSSEAGHGLLWVIGSRTSSHSVL